ncbi:MAG TPA: hypothetical protein VFM30_06730 [Steroidobacteraceae bacterium]|nr:hypothetical protein [Steroidobacteraceae bacterium]
MRVFILAITLLGLAACSEVEEQRKYQGKADTPAWGDGDRDQWERAIKARQLTQNEYRRMY